MNPPPSPPAPKESQRGREVGKPMGCMPSSSHSLTPLSLLPGRYHLAVYLFAPSEPNAIRAEGLSAPGGLKASQGVAPPRHLAIDTVAILNIYLPTLLVGLYDLCVISVCDLPFALPVELSCGQLGPLYNLWKTGWASRLCRNRVVSHLYAEALGGGLEAAGGSAAFLL